MIVHIALLAVLAAGSPAPAAPAPAPQASQVQPQATPPAPAPAPAQPQPSQSPEKRILKLASPGLTSVNLDHNVAVFYSDHFAQQLALGGLRVITASEMSALLGLERQKQLVGCTDTSCAVELANALGVDGLVVGSIGKFDTTYQVNIKVLSAIDGTPLGIYSTRATGDAALLDELTRTAKLLAAEMLRKLNRAPVQVVQIDTTREAPPPTPAQARRSILLPVLGGVGGGVLLTAGGITASIAGGMYQSLTNKNSPPRDFVEAKTAFTAGSSLQTISLVLVGAGVALVATSVVLGSRAAAEPAAQPKAAIVPVAGPGGVGVAIGGVFP